MVPRGVGAEPDAGATGGEVTEFRPDRRALWCHLAAAILSLAIAGVSLVLCGIANGGPFLRFALPAFVLVTVLSWWYAAARFNALKYVLEGDCLTACYGVIWKVKRTTPLDKVTNVDVRQGPVGRACSFGNIWVFTPSTGSLRSEMVLEALPGPEGVKKAILEGSQVAKRRLSGEPGAS